LSVTDRLDIYDCAANDTIIQWMNANESSSLQTINTAIGLWFWPWDVSPSVRLRPWVEVAPFVLSCRKGCRSCDVSMLETESRSRGRSGRNAIVTRLRLKLASPCRTNSLVSSLTSESLLYSIFVYTLSLQQSLILGLERDVVYRFRKLSVSRRTPWIRFRSDRVGLNLTTGTSRWWSRTSRIGWNRNSAWSLSTFRKYAAGDNRFNVSGYDFLATSSFIEIWRFISQGLNKIYID